MSLAGLFEKTSLKTNSKEISVLEQYAELILKWNSTRNLVSRNTNKEQINEHIFDCACITPFLDENKILDVGTGAGLPGIVVSILESKKKVTLLEPNQKKVSFWFFSSPVPVVELPWASKSISRTFREAAESEAARFKAVVVLPTPPF